LSSQIQYCCSRFYFQRQCFHFYSFPAGVTSSRSVSPASNLSVHSGIEGALQPSILPLNSEIRNKSRSLPRLSLEPTGSEGRAPLPTLKSPVIKLQEHHRVASNPSVNSCDGSAFSPTGKRYQEHRSSSPVAIAKHLFNFSTLRNSLSPHSSPKISSKISPLLSRRRFRGGRNQSNHEEESDYLYWWMEEVREGERRHWKQVLDNEGEWSYCWHSIHYRLQPAYS